MPKTKNTKKRSKVVASSKGKGISGWGARHALILALVIGVIFGGVGVWKLATSNASTYNLSYEGCFLRGRTWTSAGLCTDTCRSGAGTMVKKPGVYGYCSNSISTSISSDKCQNLRRQFVGSVGCARRWQQTTTTTALQCINNQHSYYVSDPYDYCTAPASGWVWPVPGTHQLGSLGWGEWGSKGQHKGIDIGISGGGSLGYKVVAAHSGTVTQSYDGGSCGWFIVIKAKDTPYWHAYQHLAKDGAHATRGSFVTAGQQIGKIGTAGGSTCGSSAFYHLHFSVEKGDWISWYSSPISNSIDPQSVLP